MDAALIEEAWHGKVPIKFSLASPDVSAPDPPEPVFALCSRYGFLSCSAQIAVEYFRSFVMDLPPELWFESSGCPLKWYLCPDLITFLLSIFLIHFTFTMCPFYSQLPIGVLFDMYYRRQQNARYRESSSFDFQTTSSVDDTAPSSSSSSSVNRMNISATDVSSTGDGWTSLGGPWEVVIHFHRFPHDQLLRCDLERIREQYYHSLKQALHLLHGSTIPFSNLSLERRSEMWEGACTGEFAKYAPGFRDLVPLRETVRLIPVRLIQHGTPAIQKPVTISVPLAVSNHSSTDTDATAPSTSESTRDTTLGNVINSFLQHHASRGEDLSVLVQGVAVPLHASIFEVWATLSSADLFLYIVVPYK